MESLTIGKLVPYIMLCCLMYLPHRGSVASATQGISMAIHKSFVTRGGAIVAFQVALLKGEVCLMNENQAKKEKDA